MRQDSGPIEITVVDPVSVVAGTYVLKLDSPQVSNQNFVESYYGWTLRMTMEILFLAQKNQSLSVIISLLMNLV